MKATSRCLNKGFIGRSVDEFKRCAALAMTGGAARLPSAPFPLTSFHEPESIKACKVMSDADIGGYSKASLDWQPPDVSSKPAPSETTKGHAHFHGSISTDLPASRPQVQRTGYAAWRTRDMQPTIFGKRFWDIDPYTYLALRIKSDGRKYFVNVQTQSIVPTDIHQHRLYARRPGEWETVLIKWDDFVRTNYGAVVEPQTELLRQKVKSVGVGLTDRVPGRFSLSIDRIWATNKLTEHDAAEDGRLEEGQLKSKHGEKIRWNEDKAL